MQQHNNHQLQYHLERFNLIAILSEARYTINELKNTAFIGQATERYAQRGSSLWPMSWSYIMHIWISWSEIYTFSNNRFWVGLILRPQRVILVLVPLFWNPPWPWGKELNNPAHCYQSLGLWVWGEVESIVMSFGLWEFVSRVNLGESVNVFIR